MIYEFRGLGIEDGKWHYGYYWHSESQERHNIIENTGRCQGNYPCDLTTIGMYISEHDKLGNRIYEGDVLKIYDKIWYKTGVSLEEWLYDINEELAGIQSHEIEILYNIHEHPELYPVKL